ncbi:MAG: translation initiation factor IF-6, partial [Halobacteriales archaeon]|nr:translation initiation factor IF-6 [Halobacteriales archaeon]
MDLHGSPYIGVFAAASDTLAVCPASAPPGLARELAQALGVSVVPMTVGGS